jgi:hypothetical protein
LTYISYMLYEMHEIQELVCLFYRTNLLKFWRNND